MTKDAYFEMCEALGTEPVESEIPVDMSDFPLEVTTCFDIYSILKDVWDPMGGNYLGKDYTLLFELCRLYYIDHPLDQLFTLQTLQQIDACRTKLVSNKLKANKPSS